MENIALLKERWFKKEVERLAKDNVSKADIARALDIKPQYLNSVLNGSRSLTDSFLDKFIEIYQINQFDLYNIEDTHTDSALTIRFINKLDEKDTKIDQLQTELRAMTEELATLKAKYPETTADHPEGLGHAKNASTKKPSSPNADNVTSVTAP
ncbi:helix-turn-helix transcriptional regulator [Bacteroides sp.]|uniref:helix-turn-helix domain-containing protein n=1 Tax=Bacteroides sp. TaxID=29523 RepID=UPI002628527C|nr:helix-turn-helix transcriptional regulator [Bacteroides sp.]MDD3040929.1 helix-turn-helix transcriptional regulator [Bacteroides sp.]